MIDNFDLIKEICEGNEELKDTNKFLFGQIIIRGKDHPDIEMNNSRVVKDIVFSSVNDFLTKKDDIVKMCNALGARAYININPKDHWHVAIDMAKLLINSVQNKTEHIGKRVFSTACGQATTKSSYWIIDVDYPLDYKEVVNYLPKEMDYHVVPTVNGHHILIKGFDARNLRALYSSIDIHKNNPTLLYYGNN